MTTYDDYSDTFNDDDDVSFSDDAHERYLDQLRVRPRPLNGIELPTVRNIREAELICFEFDAVVTAGPTEGECDWGHPDHRIWTFDDVTDEYGPSLVQVQEMLEFGTKKSDLLVHCHAGISRSTATAWGISIARGADAEESFKALVAAHPTGVYSDDKRTFWPNERLVDHLQTILGNKDLKGIMRAHLDNDPVINWWR